MFAAQIETAIAQAPGRSLDDIAGAVWKALATGQITEPDAERLSTALEARRAAFRASRRGNDAEPGRRPSRAITSPDRAVSIARRRKQAAAGAMPPELASHFTIGEQAALAVIVQEVRRAGDCRFFMDKIAALAGICRTTARNALRKAEALGLIVVEERRVRWWRNLSNVVRLVSKAWRRWLKIRKGGACKKTERTITQISQTGESGKCTPSVLDATRQKRVYSGYAEHRTCNHT